MIYLTANTQCNPVFTLFENTTLSGASYIINLYSNDDYTDNLFWLTGNTTTNQARYDRFPLTVNLNAGSYDYYVYQTTGNTLSLSGLTIDDIVETGLCEVSNPCGNTIFNDDKINIITFGECNNTTTTTTQPIEICPEIINVSFNTNGELSFEWNFTMTLTSPGIYEGSGNDEVYNDDDTVSVTNFILTFDAGVWTLSVVNDVPIDVASGECECPINCDWVLIPPNDEFITDFSITAS